MPNRIFSRRLFGGNGFTILPQNLLSTQTTLLEGFENAADWSAYMTQNTTNFRTGTQSLLFTSLSGGDNSADKNSVNLDCSAMLSGGVIRLYVYIYDITQISNISFNLGMEPTSWGNWFKITRTASVLVNGWNVINCIQADFQLVNAPVWTNPIRRIRMAVKANSGQVALVSFDNLSIAPQKGIPAIGITFDDGWSTEYTQAFPVMKAYGIRGSVYIITDRIDTANYMTLAQITDLHASGWNLANHTKDHTDLTGLSQGDQQLEFTNAQTALEGWGFTEASKCVAYPSGLFDDTTKAAMTAVGMSTGRTVRNQNEVLIPSHPYELKSWSCGNTVTLANRETTIDNAIARGEVAFMHFHKLVASPSDGTEWAISDFQTLMDYIYTKWKAGLIYPITISDFYNLQSGSVKIPKVK
jgi:peptidoglycan/xylan/chitin deacetylase (PgdA/CDA1 family)